MPRIAAATSFTTVTEGASRARRAAPRRSRFVGGLALAGALAAWIAGPASAQLFGGDTEARKQIAGERKRVDDLTERVQAQSAAADATRGELRALNDRLGRVEESLKSTALLDLFREIEALKAELARMRGQIEVLNNNVEVAQKRQRDLYVDLDTRMRRLESPPTVTPGAAAPAEPPAQVASATPPGGAGTTAAAAAAGKPPTGTDPAEARAYDAAQNQRRIGNYAAAIIAFQDFVKRYPKSPLASSAQYWVGDSYFNMRDYRLAIQSQRTLIAQYPDSQKVPDALLNIASSQIELGETAVARKTMEEILARHPVSEAAEKAKRRLASLR